MADTKAFIAGFFSSSGSDVLGASLPKLGICVRECNLGGFRDEEDLLTIFFFLGTQTRPSLRRFAHEGKFACDRLLEDTLDEFEWQGLQSSASFISSKNGGYVTILGVR
jgi:hypothetical protein